MTRAGVLLAVALAVACGPVVLAVSCASPQPVPPGPPPPLPPLHPPTEESCELAQATLERLECKREDGGPLAKTPKGAPFAEACKVALRDGRIWNSNCIARITECDQFDCAYRGYCCDGAR